MANPKKMMGVLVSVIFFSAVIGLIATSLVTAALNLSGTAAILVGTTLITLIALGFVWGTIKQLDLV